MRPCNKVPGLPWLCSGGGWCSVGTGRRETWFGALLVDRSSMHFEHVHYLCFCMYTIHKFNIYIYIQSNVHSLCSVRYVALFWSMHVHMESHTSSMLKKHGYQCGTWWRFPNCIDQPRTIWLLLLVNPFSTISGKTFFHCCSLHRWIELASLAHAQIWSPTATQCSVCRISQPCTATCLGGTQAVTSSYVWLKDVRICLPNLSFPFLSLPFSTSRMEWIE